MRSLPFYFHLKILDNCFELTLCQSRFTKPFKCPSSWVISQPNKVLNHTRLILRVKEFLLRVEGFFLLKLSDFSFEMNYQLLLPSNGIKYWTIWGSFWGRKSSSWGLRDFFVAVISKYRRDPLNCALVRLCLTLNNRLACAENATHAT